ncbi:MAG: hypothetical protein IPJ79_20240 [Bacteroidetes bacterium]|nr:hypothetical protein [Bacteroidota bacterium]
MTKTDDTKTKEVKIRRYHSDEIRLVLFICATDLKKYSHEDLIVFAESIEGRIEVLLTPEFLKSVSEFIQVDSSSMKKIQELKRILQELYSSQWHLKMTDSSWTSILILSREILELLSIEYQEPLIFMKNNLEVDWTL